MKLPEIADPFKAIAKLLERERKLKPLIKRAEAQNYTNKDKVTINLHIVKAENVPIREEYRTDIKKDGGRGGQMQENDALKETLLMN